MALTTTAEWHEAIKAQFRYQAYLKFNLRLTPPGLQENMSVSGDSTDPHSNISVLKDGVASKPPKKWATLEQNRWRLDGTWDVMVENTKVDDYWTKPIKDVPAEILFTFDQPYNVPGINVVWDTTSGTFPAELVVHGYNYAKEETYTFTVQDIKSSSGFLSLSMDAVQYVGLEIKEWSLPTWRARLNEVTFGINIDYDSLDVGRIKSVTQVSAVEPLMSKLPTRSMSMRLRNDDQELDPLLSGGTAKYLADRQLVQVQWGFTVAPDTVEWLAPMNYYLSGFTVPVNTLDVTLNLEDKLYFLTEDVIKDAYTGEARTFKEIALGILESSAIIKDSIDDIPYEIADTLDSMYTTAPAPRKAANLVLQLIAGATGTILHTDPETGHVRIDEVALGLPVHEIGEMQALEKPSITLQKPLKSIMVSVYKYVTIDTVNTIAEGSYHINGTQKLTITYNVDAATNVSATVTGGTLVSVEYYASAAIVTVSATDADVKITLTGKEVRGQATYITSFEDGNVAQGENVILDNPFITESEYVAQLTEWIKLWYQKRQIYNLDYLGYPELVAGDIIGLTTIYGSQPVLVTQNKIDFNGGWNGNISAL